MTQSSLVRPAFFTEPARKDTFGPEVADLCRLAGFDPDPEQALALDAIFGFGPDGKATAFEFAVVCPRQNMKTGLFKMAVIGWLFITEQRLIVWSAHEMKTTKEAFFDLVNLIEGCPALKSRLADGPSRGIHRGNGDESIELATGQRVMFKARTAGGGRGLTGDKVILDEAFALEPAHMGSLLPTLSARPDPQVVYGSSAGLARSDVLRSIRDRGRKGDVSLAYIEFCDDLPGGCQLDQCDHAVGRPGCVLDDPARWARGNTALGRRITESYIAAERRALPPKEFARERLGWWDEPDGTAGFPLDAWARRGSESSAPGDPVVFGLDAAPNLASAAIVACGPYVDGEPTVEVVEHRAGTSWVVGWLEERRDRYSPLSVAVDPSGPVGALLPDLERLGINLVELDGKQAAQACSMFVAAVVDGHMWHQADPRLTGAVENAAQRPSADSWRWSRKNSRVDICPLVAATNALWLQSTELPAEPNVYFI